jgi:hypothetical protein
MNSEQSLDSEGRERGQVVLGRTLVEGGQGKRVKEVKMADVFLHLCECGTLKPVQVI